MRHLFIINPVAGGKKHDPRKTEEEIKTAMAENGGEYEIYYTAAPKDAIRRVREEAAMGGEIRIYACGGDGTLNECVTGAAGFSNAAVAHYPCGTGNDFIKCFEDERTRFSDLQGLINGEIFPIDLISCGKGRYGLNISSVGIDARIGSDVHKYSALPLIGGSGGYIVSTIVNVFKGINQPLTITVGGKTFKGKFSMVCACNGRYYGGSFNPVPEAMPNDGLLDMLIVKDVNIFTLARLIGKYAAGKYKELPEYITHIRAKNITIESPREILIGYDGESFRGRQVTFSAVSKGVNMIFPANMKFFESERGKKRRIRRKAELYQQAVR